MYMYIQVHVDPCENIFKNVSMYFYTMSKKMFCLIPRSSAKLSWIIKIYIMFVPIFITFNSAVA